MAWFLCGLVLLTCRRDNLPLDDGEQVIRRQARDETTDQGNSGFILSLDTRSLSCAMVARSVSRSASASVKHTRMPRCT